MTLLPKIYILRKLYFERAMPIFYFLQNIIRMLLRQLIIFLQFKRPTFWYLLKQHANLHAPFIFILCSASAIGGLTFNVLWSLYLKPYLIQQAWTKKFGGSIGVSPFVILGTLLASLQFFGFFILCLNAFCFSRWPNFEFDFYINIIYFSINELNIKLLNENFR